ncbi:TonB-dependent receptor [Roseateles sp. BYS87W]|uniref:TonB-dependent receptor n=1 Tax=Pelomonas baiyunensis TaxID=3299026 RepID=A0ABW7H2G6_9BURK
MKVPFKSSPIAIAAMIATIMAPTGAMAADAADVKQLETVSVQGLRQSLEKAQEAKRNADQVMDAIRAEDIGKFPDKTLGEALQRVAGVQVGRDKADVTSVLIRGLPDVATTLNGHEIFTAEGRRLAYQDLPVDSIAGVDVFKAQTPGQLEGGIAGLLNVRTRLPFDNKGLVTTFYAKLDRVNPIGNAGPDLNNPTIGGLVSNRWHTPLGEVGVLLDATYKRQHFNHAVQWVDVPDHIWNVRADGTGERNFSGTAPAGAALGSMGHVGGVYNQGKVERPSAHAALQWKPSQELELNTQLVYMGYKARTEEDYIGNITGWAPAAKNLVTAPQGPWCNTNKGNVCPILSGYFPAETNPASGVYSVDPYTFDSTQARDMKTTTAMWNVGGVYRSGPLKVESDAALSYSKFKVDDIVLDQAIIFPSAQVWFYDEQGHGGFKVTNPNSATPFLDANQFRLRALNQNWHDGIGRQLQWRNDVSYQTGHSWLPELLGGLRLSSHKAEAHGADSGRDVPGGGLNSQRPKPTDIFGAGIESLVPGIDRLGGAFLTPSVDYLLDQTDKIRSYYGFNTGRLAEDPNRMFKQKEDTVTLHGAGRFVTALGGVELSGVAGLRVVHLKRNLKGINQTGAYTDASGVAHAETFTPFDIDTAETNVLPSVNLRIDWGDNWVSRVAAGKTISRPNFGDLNPALALTPANPPNVPVGHGGSGNPDLKPVKSQSLDFSLEYYFARNGFVQGAAFYRKIDGYVYGLTRRETINGAPSDIGRPFNAGKGNLKGYELTAQKFLDFLPGWLSGFGASANFTYIDGKTDVADNVEQTSFSRRDLFGVSKKNINLSLLYEKDGLTGRVSVNHRDKYLEGLNGGQISTSNYVKASTYVDLGVGYRLTESLSLQFDALNVTAQHYESYMDSVYRPRDIRYQPRTYSVGLRVKL